MGDAEFINTFLDNVRVPAESLVGKLNGGWEVLTGSLGTERGIVGAAIVAKLMRSFDIVCELLEVDSRAARLHRQLVKPAI